MTQKQCSSCGSGFGCDADTNDVACWCKNVTGVIESPEPGIDCLCPQCLEKAIATQRRCDGTADSEPTTPRALVEGEDYYLESGNLVFTRQYHLKRGYCCESGCRHCPWRTDESVSERTFSRG